MKVSLTVLALVAVAAFGVAGAHADGVQTSPGAETGWEGAVARDGKVRYVALPGYGSETIVAAVRLRGGRVVRWGVVRGAYGVPLVAYDGTKGGLTADGTTLVLTEATSNPGRVSRFPVLSTRILRVRSTVTLRGRFSFDAVSPDGSTLFLVEYFGTGPNVPYRVRAYDLRAERLVAGAIVDRLEKEATMLGQPVTRATSRDGRWAYTLYARQEDEPFVHALDTVRREAFCVDLPLELGQPKQMALRLRLVDGGRRLTVRSGARVVAEVDTRSFDVRTRG
jgi:hypothetical protein